GRFSPATAIVLVFLGTAILAFDWRPMKPIRLSGSLILCSALIAATALLGYLFGQSAPYQVSTAPIMGAGVPMLAMRILRASGGMLILGVAVPTAIGAFMISLGLLLERPNVGIMRVVTSNGPGGMLLRRLAPAAILASAVFGFIAARFPALEDTPLVF